MVLGQETGDKERGFCYPPRTPDYHRGKARAPTPQPPTSCSPSPKPRCAFAPCGHQDCGALCAWGTALARVLGGVGGQHLPSELRPSPAPAATCGLVTDTRARPAPPSTAAARPLGGSAPGAWPRDSPPPPRHWEAEADSESAQPAIGP